MTLAALAMPATSAHAQVLEQRIVHPAPLGPAFDESFGLTVDISGDALIVGAPGDLGPNALHSGCAIYEYAGGTWSLAYDRLQQFAPEDNAGWGVAIDGDWAAFSVLNVQGASLNAGEVHILHRDVGGWTETQILTSPDFASGYESFGIDVDISGTLLVVGSPWQDQAFVYRLGGSTWGSPEALTAPAGFVQTDSGFGYAVAVSQTGSREAVIVGQPGFDAAGGSPTDEDGAAHVFVYDSAWIVVTNVTPAMAPSMKSFLGFPVAIDGDVAVVGAYRAFEQVAPFTQDGGLVALRWNVDGFDPSLLISGETGEFAGLGLAALGDRVFTGRPGWEGTDAHLLDTGRVTGHDWTGSTWASWPTSGGSFFPTESPPNNGAFSYSLAAEGSRLVVGCPGMPAGGSIYVLDVGTEAWKWSDAQVGGLDTVVGSTGPARLIGEGSLDGGDGHRLHLHGARPSTLVALIVGVTTINVPFKTGILVPHPQWILYVATNPAGQFHVTTTFPNGVPSGIPIWHHMWWSDPAAPAGFASSNAIRGITP